MTAGEILEMMLRPLISAETMPLRSPCIPRAVPKRVGFLEHGPVRDGVDLSAITLGPSVPLFGCCHHPHRHHHRPHRVLRGQAGTNRRGSGGEKASGGGRSSGRSLLRECRDSGWTGGSRQGGHAHRLPAPHCTMGGPPELTWRPVPQADTSRMRRIRRSPGISPSR